MANPQPDKFTRISNELLEKFLMVGIKMKPSAIAVWLAIARKTYGYHKKKDRISLSQLAEMTDLERRSVCRALKQLKSFNMIIDDNGLRGIQKDYELWQIGTKRSVTKRSDDQLATIGSDQTATNGDKSSDQLVHLVVTKQPHTKESIKERVNIKKEEKDNIPFAEIVSHLNSISGKRYSPRTKQTIKDIKGRWEDGWRLDDFKYVHLVKATQWLDDPEREQYLAPATLYRQGNFEKYRNQRPKSEFSGMSNRQRENIRACVEWLKKEGVQDGAIRQNEVRNGTEDVAGSFPPRDYARHD